MKEQTNLKRILTLAPVVMIGLAYMDPLVVFDSFGVVAQLTKGHTATSYIVIVVALLFTAYSYGKMVQAYPFAGSTYTYTQRSFSPYVGFLVGWAVMLDYLFLPMVNYAIGGVYLSSAFPAIPYPIWVIILATILTTVTLLGVKLTANVNTLFVSFQLLVTITFVGFMVKGITNGIGAGVLISSEPFYSTNIDLGLIMSGAAILCFSFLGFDAVTTLSEETLEPKKTIPRAIFLVALIGGVLFTTTSYFLQLVHPDFAAYQDADAASMEIAELIGGAFLQTFFLSGSMVAVCSSSLASQTSASRLLFAMGREDSLPKRFFGYIHPKLGTPVFNILFIGVISLTAIMGELEVIFSFISFGALIGFTFVNLSVIAHYFVRNKQRGGMDTIRYLVIPAIGAVVSMWLFTSLHISALILGVSWIIVGVVYSFFIRKKKLRLDLAIEEA
ncbi:APC family permease [Aneurinibacillus thermoaerophilus]|uniref:Putrescine:proton symporter, AAT family n=1 Tax=Aneurinibacillus thermoaerophilus TaxID=143495 RepID=A0A1G8DZG0_ANETH|nr:MULTISPECIES: APC family permease [Aneurinibacillus]AMA74156.1 Putrescine importer PuuP [Aneurinibacillus sp. XH2]MED0677260.1 APC family permease [Aneurinibacillus thermoaerophilus]MED0758390.1 APC family permease [Aneurinibacillus thermoaerophilus]MED0760401.1 APC family permease [Aneurinibacillus thermoaerophilus]SDH63112.1 putrescine:proton symporter, AAT family [Aneurinibacillus thermoaerophilus]